MDSKGKGVGIGIGIGICIGIGIGIGIAYGLKMKELNWKSFIIPNYSHSYFASKLAPTLCWL